MNETAESMKGKVHGNVIRFDHDLGFSEGQEVTVIGPVAGVTPPRLPRGFAEVEERWQEAWNQVKDLAPGEGFRRAAGAWAVHAEEVDELVKEIYEQRAIEGQRWITVVTHNSKHDSQVPGLHLVDWLAP